jgi:aspartyl-tRNA(Asn)/glutamyl-tRNA(Gln) amidotransferase subunit A
LSGSQFFKPPALPEVADLTGSPAVAVPTGFASTGLPLSMQIIGKPFDEATVYRVARAYEQATPWTTTHPTLA